MEDFEVHLERLLERLIDSIKQSLFYDFNMSYDEIAVKYDIRRKNYVDENYATCQAIRLSSFDIYVSYKFFESYDENMMLGLNFDVYVSNPQFEELVCYIDSSGPVSARNIREEELDALDSFKQDVIDSVFYLIKKNWIREDKSILGR